MKRMVNPLIMQSLPLINNIRWGVFRVFLPCGDIYIYFLYTQTNKHTHTHTHTHTGVIQIYEVCVHECIWAKERKRY